MLWPSLAIGVTCRALVLLGNALRDTLERSDHGTGTRPRDVPLRFADTGAPMIRHPDDAFAAEVLGEKLLEVTDLVVGYDTPGGGVSVVVGLRGTKIGYVPQEPMSSLDPAFTIGSQLVEPMRATLHLPRKDATDRALALLARVGIPDPKRAFRSYPHHLSGGMAQRVLIAGAVSCDPGLPIADEPTTALDVTVQAEVLDLLRDLQRERNMGVLMVTRNFGIPR